MSIQYVLVLSDVFLTILLPIAVPFIASNFARFQSRDITCSSTADRFNLADGEWPYIGFFTMVISFSPERLDISRFSAIHSFFLLFPFSQYLNFSCFLHHFYV